MADLRVGNRIPIFVTHVEFQNSGCQAFAHVGDLGSQADTVIERTDEYVGSGGAEIPAACSVGDLCLALFHEDGGWYRAQVLSVSGSSVTVFFIDYGNTETVKIDKLRTASDYVLAIPPLTTKCNVADCKPLNEQSWSEEEIKKIESMLHSQEFIAEIVNVDSSTPVVTCTVQLFKTDEPNVPVFLRKSSSSSDLTVKMEELQIGQNSTVFVSFVESAQKFWVQLKQKESELNSLMSDIGACFAEDLPSSGDIVDPTPNQICASCFSEDGSFYRAKVQSITGESCKVFFVDYGNSENKSTSELFTLPQVLAQLPMQAIQCSYRSNKDTWKVEEILHKLETDGTPCVITALSKSNSGYAVQIDVVEKQINASQGQSQSVRGKEVKLWTSIPSAVMQVGGVYDVCISHIEHPGNFFVQLIGNASALDDVMQSIDEIAHNLDSIVIANPGTLCLAKYSDDAWYRSEIISNDDGKLIVGAIDFGFIEEFSSKQKLRNIDKKFRELPAQSILCSLDSEKLDSRSWSETEINKFSALAEKTALVCRVRGKKEAVLVVDLFDTTKDQETQINKEMNSVSVNGPVSGTGQKRPIQNTRKEQLKLPPPETTLGLQMTLCVTALKSTLVFGQVTHTPVEKVAKLQTDLNDHYDKKSTELLDNVDLGSVCCTQYSDGGWYRGVVTSLQGGQVEVSFADFGDSIVKSKSDLKALVPSLCELPQQCILVGIENLPSVPGSKLESVLLNKRIDVKLKNKMDGVYPQFSGELLSQSILDELEGKTSTAFGAKFGQSSQQNAGFGGGFGRRQEDGSGDSGFGAKREGFGGRRNDGGFGSKPDTGFGGGFGEKKGFGGGGSGGKGCFKCGEEGHMSRDCPSGGGGSGGKGCFKCGEEGHMSRDCPSGGGGGGGKGCFKCGEEGHISRDCPTGGGGGRGKGCFKCGEEGHMSRDCPTGGGGGRGKGCFKCGEEGHMSRDCPNGGGFGNNTERSGFGDRKGGGFGDRKEGGGFGERKSGGFGNRDSGGFGGRNDGGGFGKRDGGFGDGGGGFGKREGGFGDAGGGFGKREGGFGEGGGGFGKKEGSFGDGGGGFGKRDSGFGSRGGEESQNKGFSRGPRAPSGDSGAFARQVVEIGSTKGVMVTYVRDPGHFQIVLEDMSDSLDVVMDQLHEHYDKLPPNGEQLENPRLGQACVAQYSEDKGWYRATISGLLSNGLSEVMFVDYGNNECTPRETLKTIKDEFLTMPAQAILCSLAGVAPTQGFWSPEHTVQFEEMVVEQSFMATFKSQNREPGQDIVYKVELVDKKGVNINQKFGSSTGTTCVDTGTGPRGGPQTFGGSAPVSDGDGWDESPDTGQQQGFGQGRKFGGDRGGGGFRGDQREDRGFSSRDRGSGFGNSDRDKSFGDRKAGFSGNRDQGREGGGFGGQRSGRGFGQSDDSGQRGFGQRSRDEQGGFGGKKSFDRGGGGDSGGGFGGSKGGFGGNRGGFGGNSGGGSNAGGEDDWDTESTAVPVSLPAKPQQSTGVKRFRGLNSVDEDIADDVFVNLILNVRETVDVYVVYTVNLDLFYCQVMKNSASLAELMDQMNSYYEGLTEGDMTIERPEIGMPCAAKFSEDDRWYRAEIQTPGQMKVEVQFIDYGNTEMIAVSKIRQLKPEFMKMKSQGIKCGLDGVVAKEKVWSDKAIEDFEDLTMDKHLVGKVINRSSDGTHLLELENVEENVNIGDIMCEKGHCSYVSSKISPKKDQVIESPYPAMKFEVGSEMDVYVSTVENPELFWIQPVSDEDKLVEFVDTVQELYTSEAGVDKHVTSVLPGQAVVALFSEDGAWYRGYVEKKTAKDIKVRFVDYGNSDNVTRENLRAMTEEMMKEPGHAVQCKLKGIRPLQTGVWTSDARDIMNSLVGDVIVKCKVLDVTGKQYTVELLAEETDVAKELIQAAVVRADKEPSPQPKESAGVPHGERVKTLFFKNQANVDVGSTEHVYVTQTDSVASFWCQLVKYYSQLDQLMGNLETYCNSKPAAEDFSVNMACGAKFSVDGSWYRGKVMAVYPDSVEVLFVDYGNSEKVKKSDIRNLTEELIEFPTQALHCTLENTKISTNQLTKKFLELTSDVEISMTVVEVQEDITVVQLALTSGENIAEQLGLVNSKATEVVTGESKVSLMPTDEKYPKAKIPSSPVQVYVSHISSPGEFHVQLVNQEAQLTELMEKVAAAYEDETKFKVASLLEGQSCCSKFAEDGQWYRAESLGRDRSEALVRFVDYGNDQRTTMDNVRNITEELLKMPPFAYRCKLANVGMADGSPIWSTSAVERFESLVMDQELMCEFISDNEVKLMVNGEDVAEKLLEVSGVVDLSGQTKKPEAVSIDFTNYTVAVPSLPAESCTCYVSYVRSNGFLYLQLAHEEENLNRFTESLQEKAASLPTVPSGVLKVGDFCVAKYSVDQAWYRARVEAITDTSITVRFLDYGNSDQIENYENLKCPNEDLAKEHPYSYECKLQGVDHSVLDVNKLHEITAEKELSCVFHSSELPYEVELHDEEGKSIRDLVISGEVAEGMVTPTSSEKNEAAPTDLATRDDETDIQENLSEETAEVNIDLDNIVTSLQELESEILESDQRTRVKVSHANSPGEFWVQLVSKKTQLDELLNQMFDLYSAVTDDKLNIDDIDTDMVVAALFSEDESWYRARVLKVGDDEVVVQFLDHGNEETVPVTSLRKLPTTYSELPLQGILCSLAGVAPKDGGEWSEETSEAFNELTLEKELLLDVCGKLENGVYQVQLLDMGIPISETLLKRGVGVELATPVPVSTKTKQVFSPETKEEIMARLFEPKASEKLTRYGYKMRDFGLLEPTIEQPAVVNIINNPTDFWCQISDNSYDYLQEKLTESYAEACEMLGDCEVGTRCVLKLDDKEYFRGSVIDLDSDKVTVLCVDNGYRHEVNKSDLFDYKMEFDKFPQLAFPCALDIRTFKSDEDWGKDVCDKFKEVVLELSEVEHLPAFGRLTIVRLKDDGTAIVKLTIDRLSIGDHLVQLDMAEICDRLEELEINEKSDTESSQKLSEFGSYVNIKVPVDSENDVHLIDCDNLDRLVFHTLEGKTVVDEITEKIAEYVKDREPDEDSWSKGQSCLVKCPEDDKWYRANIIGEMQGKYQVFFVDYGSFYTVPETALLPIPESLAAIKAQAVICKLSEIEPVDEDWSEEAVDFFAGHFCNEDEPTKLCVYVSKFEAGVHEVSLSQNSEEKTANMLMVELGFAVPILGSALEMELLTDHAETSFHELSLAREDSFDSELGETSYEGDTTNVTTDTSVVDHDTSCLDTETSHNETDTSQTETDVSCVEVDQSRFMHDISADQSGLETDLSRLDINKSQVETDISQTENEESYLETEQSHLDTEPSYLEGDTSQDMSHFELDRSEVEIDRSHIAEDTSFQETDTSETEVDTSCLNTDTSCLETTDTTCLETTDTSCLETTDTSFIDTDTSCLDTDTSCLDTDTSCLDTDTSALETDTTETSVTESDISVVQGDESSCTETVLGGEDRDDLAQLGQYDQGQQLLEQSDQDQQQLEQSDQDQQQSDKGDALKEVSQEMSEAERPEPTDADCKSINGIQKLETKDAENKSETEKIELDDESTDSGVVSKTDDKTEPNGVDNEGQPKGKVGQAGPDDDSDTETFEDADVSMGETGVAGGKRDGITPDKDSTEESEAFYDVESEDESK